MFIDPQEEIAEVTTARISKVHITQNVQIPAINQQSKFTLNSKQ